MNDSRKHTSRTIDSGYPTKAHGRIPAFQSVEEEAAFWDSHELTDFLEESEPTQVTVGPELTERLSVRLDEADRDELARQAERLGVGPSTLARIWLKERLRQETGSETE